MAKKKSAERRKRYFIRRSFQTAFILKFCSLLLMGVMISTALLFLFSRDTLTSSFQHSELVIENTATAILPTAVFTNLVTLGLIAIATIIVVLFVSHKLAGPLFRFDKEIKEIAEGNLTTVVTLRSKDQITDLAETLNHMTGSLRDKILSIQKDVAQSIETASQENASDRLIQELNQLQTRIGEHFTV